MSYLLDPNNRLAWTIVKRAQWVATFEDTTIVARTKTLLMVKMNVFIKEYNNNVR